jgi:hypothetical protein
MAPTVVSGVRSTTNALASSRRIVDMANEIFQYDPDVTPMLAFVQGRAATERTGNPQFQHLEDEPLPAWDTLAQAITSTTQTNGGAAGFLPTNVGYFRSGDLVLIPTSTLSGGEVVRVTTSAAGASFIVVRNWNGDQTTGGTALISSNIFIIGNANEENAGVRTILTTTEANVSNYVQIIRTPVGASGTEDGSDLYGGKDRAYQRRKMATQHAFEQERAFIFGKKAEVTGTTHKVRATGGLLSWITTNVTNVNGTLTASALETFFSTAFRYGSKTKLVLVSRLIASQLDLIAEGRVQTVPNADTYGVNVGKYVTTHGTLMVHIHDMLEKDYAGYAIVVDLSNIKKRYMVNSEGKRDGMLRTNIEAPDVDGWVDEYLSEVGLHVIQEKTHAVLKGVS